MSSCTYVGGGDGVEEWRSSALSLLQCTLSLVPVGYEMTCLNVPQLHMEPLMNATFHATTGIVLDEMWMSVLWALVIAAQSIGAMTSLWLTVPLVEHFGTRHSIMIISNIFCVLGVLSTAFAPTRFMPIFVGRLLIGVHSGIVVALLPVYISSISSPRRVAVNTLLIHATICLGTAIGALLSLGALFGQPALFDWLMACPACFSLIQVILSTSVPDTPVDLLASDRLMEAREAVKFYYGDGVDVQTVLNAARPPCTTQSSIGHMLLHSERGRRAALLSTLLATATNMCGSGVLLAYSTSVLVSLGITSTWIVYVPALAGLLSALASVIALPLLRQARRRHIVMITFPAVTLLLVAWMAVSFTLPSISGTWLLACIILLFLLAYTSGPAPLTWCVPSELAAAHQQTATVALTSFVYWLSAAVSNLAFYPMYSSVGPWAYMLFIVPMIGISLALLLYLPETKHKGRGDPTRTPLLLSNTSNSYD